MFDLEDAAGQRAVMSLDNQRSLKLAISRHALFMEVARQVMAEGKRAGKLKLNYEDPTAKEIDVPAGELTDEEWEEWQAQLEFTLAIVRARGQHLCRCARRSDPDACRCSPGVESHLCGWGGRFVARYGARRGAGMGGGRKQQPWRLRQRSRSAVPNAVTTSQSLHASARNAATPRRADHRIGLRIQECGPTSLGGLDHGNERQSEHSSEHL